jgi:hypothetical protein
MRVTRILTIAVALATPAALFGKKKKVSGVDAIRGSDNPGAEMARRIEKGTDDEATEAAAMLLTIAKSAKDEGNAEAHKACLAVLIASSLKRSDRFAAATLAAAKQAGVID